MAGKATGAAKKRRRPRQLVVSSNNFDSPADDALKGPTKVRRTTACSPSFLTPTLSKLSQSASSLDVSSGRSGHSFFDLDSLESGAAREVVHPNVLSPLVSSEWTYGYVKRVVPSKRSPCKRMFMLHRDVDHAFLLSAAEYDGKFYISQHRRFTTAFNPLKPLDEQELEGRYVAMLRPRTRGAGQFELVTFACQNCDTRLGKYSCGGVHTDDPSREVLALITQAVRRIPGPEFVRADARCLSISIPRAFKDGTRAVWCPRCPKGSMKGFAMPALLTPSVARSRVRPRLNRSEFRPAPLSIASAASAPSGLPTAADVAVGAAAGSSKSTSPGSRPGAGSPVLQPATIPAGGATDTATATATATDTDTAACNPPAAASSAASNPPAAASSAASSPPAAASCAAAAAAGTRRTIGAPAVTESAAIDPAALKRALFDGTGHAPRASSSSGAGGSARGSASPPPLALPAAASPASTASSSGGSVRVTSAVRPAATATGPTDTTELQSVMPRFVSLDDGLVMEFLGDRIDCSSTKNFVLCDTESDKYVMQFGKRSNHTFVLDVRTPLSLLQGFGVFLSAFNWTAPNPRS